MKIYFSYLLLLSPFLWQCLAAEDKLPSCADLGLNLYAEVNYTREVEGEQRKLTESYQVPDTWSENLGIFSRLFFKFQDAESNNSFKLQEVHSLDISVTSHRSENPRDLLSVTKGVEVNNDKIYVQDFEVNHFLPPRTAYPAVTLLKIKSESTGRGEAVLCQTLVRFEVIP